jgi:hypothetical protein
MGLYVDLTAEEKSIIGAWERNARGGFNSIARLVNEFRALQAALDASNGPRDIITGLDAGEEIPNTSGLAGAHDMTKAEWSSLVALLDGFLTTYDTAANRQLYAKASGPTAGL